MELYPLRGMVGNAGLFGPTLLHFELEADGCTAHPADPKGRDPESVVQREYDLVFPTTVVPLGQLRRSCGVAKKLPTTPAGRAAVHRAKHLSIPARRSEEATGLLPGSPYLRPVAVDDLWSVPFEDWTADQWNHPDNVSALWDLKAGEVLWAHGTGDLAWIRSTGQPPKQFFGWPD